MMEFNVYPIDDQDEHTVVDKDPSGISHISMLYMVLMCACIERFERYQKCLGIGAYKKVFLLPY